jgi:hypothetical protein
VGTCRFMELGMNVNLWPGPSGHMESSWGKLQEGIYPVGKTWEMGGGYCAVCVTCMCSCVLISGHHCEWSAMSVCSPRQYWIAWTWRVMYVSLDTVYILYCLPIRRPSTTENNPPLLMENCSCCSHQHCEWTWDEFSKCFDMHTFLCCKHCMLTGAFNFHR